jgi:hypothetical protein
MWFEQSIELRLLSNVTRSADASAWEASREERTCSEA